LVILCLNWTFLYFFDTLIMSWSPSYETTSMDDEILTVREVAKYLKVGERTIYRLATSCRLPAFKVGGTWRIKKSELDRWIEQGQHAVPLKNKNRR